MNNKLFFWRIVAIIATLIWSIVFLANKAYPPPDIGFSVVSLFITDILSVASIMASIVLIFFPMQFYIYSIMCCLWGLSNLIDIGSTNGILMYLLGCAFAYYKQFFAKREPKHEPIKGLMLFAPLLIVIAFEYRLGVDMVVSSILTLLFLGIFFVLMYFLVIDPFFVQRKIQHFKQLKKIDLSVLTAEELSIVKEVLEDKIFFAIGQDRNIGESGIKQQMSGIYKKLEIYNKAHLAQLYEEGNLIFPE